KPEEGAEPSTVQRQARLAGLDHKNLLRLPFLGQFLLPRTRGQLPTGRVVLTPHLSQKRGGAVTLEDKHAALWGGARFLPVREEHQLCLSFAQQDNRVAFHVHSHGVVAGGHNLIPCRELKRHGNRHFMVENRTGLEGYCHCKDQHRCSQGTKDFLGHIISPSKSWRPTWSPCISSFYLNSGKGETKLAIGNLLFLEPTMPP